MSTHRSFCQSVMKLGFHTCTQAADALVVRPLKIVLIVVLAIIASRLAARVTRRFITSVGARAPAHLTSERAPKRANAIASTTSGVARVIVWVIAVPLILGEVGVNLGPFVAGATIIGAALGFGAQSLVKDLLAGLMILSEDQYAVGDTIFAGDTSGTVEDVNLMRTRVRANDGKVWYIANGEIRKVANASLGWSQASAELQLPYDSDLDAAVAAASSAAADMSHDPEWEDAIIAPPEAYGVGVKVEGITVRVTATTRPAISAKVSQALLARVSRRVRGGEVAAEAGPGGEGPGGEGARSESE